MKRHVSLRFAAVLLLVAPLAGLGGCPQPIAVIGFTIAARTFVFLLEQAGVIEARAGETTRTGGVVTLPFDSTPSDRPGSGQLNVGTTRVLALDDKPGAAQALDGVATITVSIADAAASDPCADGEELGAFEVRFAGSAVTVTNRSLQLPPRALGYVITGGFTICLETTTTAEVMIVIEEMSVTFGPAVSEPVDQGPPASPPVDLDPNVASSPSPPTSPPLPDPVDDSTPADPEPSDSAADDAPIPPSYVAANIVHRGYERIIAGSQADPASGFVLPEKFNIGRIALSGDGQHVWFYLYWDSISPRPADWIRLYRMRVDGTELQRCLINEEAEAVGGGYLTTNLDGSVGVFEMTRFEPAGVFPRGESRFLRLSPGLPAAPFYDTESDAGLPSAGAVRVTDDGAHVYWYNIERLWTTPVAGGGAIELASVAHLNFYGPWDPFTGGQLFGFDISGDGAEWLLGVRFLDPQTNALRWELVQSGGALPQNLDGVANQANLGLTNEVHLSDDGMVVGYAESNAFGVGGSFVQSSTYALDLRVAGQPSVDGAYGLVLADSGNRALVELNKQNTRTPVFHDLGVNVRRRAGSTRYVLSAGGVYARQLSDDGRTCLGLWNSNPIGTPFNNLYVLVDEAAAPVGHPSIDSVAYRFDDANDALVVRAKVSSPAPLERVYLLPHKDGVEPLGVVSAEQNPLWNERSGGGVNLSTLLAPVEGEPGVYERAIRLDGKKAFLDSTYSLRIIAVDATGTRTTFSDVAPF